MSFILRNGISFFNLQEAKAFLEGDISAEREKNQRLMVYYCIVKENVFNYLYFLQSEVARLEAALHFFWAFRNSQGQKDADKERKQMEQLYKVCL